MEVLRNEVRTIEKKVVVEVASDVVAMGNEGKAYAEVPVEWLGKKISCVLKPEVHIFRRPIETGVLERIEPDKSGNVVMTPVNRKGTRKYRSDIYNRALGMTLSAFCRKLKEEKYDGDNSSARQLIKDKIYQAGFGKEFERDKTIGDTVAAIVIHEGFGYKRKVPKVKETAPPSYKPSGLLIDGPIDKKRDAVWQEILGMNLRDFLNEMFKKNHTSPEVIAMLIQRITEKGYKPNIPAIGATVWMRERHGA